MPDRLVHVRVMGPPEAVEDVARRLRDVLPVAEESADYPRRRDLGVRRYLTVVLGGGAATPARRRSPESTLARERDGREETRHGE